MDGAGAGGGRWRQRTRVAPMAEVQWRSDGGLGSRQRNGHSS